MTAFPGNEFVEVLDNLQDEGEAGSVASKIHASLTMPMVINGYPLPVSATMGIAFITRDIRDPEALLAKADHVLYEAKQRGRGGYAFA